MRKLRRILSYFMIIVMVTFLSSGVNITNVSANERFNTNSGILEYSLNNSNSKVIINKYLGTDKKLEIPSEINGMPVIKINDNAFKGSKTLENIVIPQSVTEIGYAAFWGCSNLFSVIIPNSVLSIGNSAFHSCTNLSSITIPNSITNIGDYTFHSCTNLSKVVIPNSVKSIGSLAFCNCKSLTSLTIPSSIISIDASAFDFCLNLINIDVDEMNNYYSDEAGVLFTKNKDTLIQYPTGKKEKMYRIPNLVKKINKFAFARCNNITNITMDNSIEEIGKGAFYNCNNLENIEISEGVVTIEEEAFKYCNKLKSIVIPNSVTNINDETFSYCSNLTNIIIPNSVTSIKWRAFYNCNNLISITIPNSVASINAYAFEGCDNLTIYGYKNSYAETYAKQYKIPFKVIGTEIDDDTNTQSTQLTMSPDKYTCDVDGVVDLIAGLVSSNITGEDVVWTSDNENIAIIEDTSYINSSDNSQILLHARVKGISEGTANITVETKDGVKASATVNVEKKVVKPEVRDNRLKWSVDTFDFVNSEEDFGLKAGSNIFIGNFYKEALLEKLENMNNSTDKKVIEDELKDGKWGGSCYGMSAVAVLNKIGKIDISSIEGLKGAKNLNELEKPCINEDVKSLINFYHLQCSISEYTNRGVDFRKKTLKEQLKYIVDETEKVKEGGIPLIIDYAWVKDENKVKDDDTDIDNDEDTSGYGAHAVVAYDIEKDKEYEFDGVKYKYKVRVYDPNMLCDVSKNDIVKEGDKYCIYINEDFSKWIIPEAKGTISSNGKYTTYKLYNVDGIFDKLGEAIIQNVTNDLKVIDYVNFGEVIESHTAILKSEKEKKFKIKDRQKNVFFDIDGLNIKDSNEIYTFFEPNYLGTSSTLRIALANYDNEYMVEFDKNKKFDLSLQYDECYLKASSSLGNNVSFSPNGKVSLESDNSDFKLSVTVNETNLPWHTISASGTNANEVSLEKTDEGVVLKGDNLKDVMVSGENDDETKEIKINTDEKEILIKDENNEMKAFVDTDNDGTFESELDDTVQEKEIKLDKSNISLEIGKEEQLKATITPEDLNENISWSSEDEKVATVDEKGLVKAVGEGTTNIKATIGDITAVCKVVVIKPNKNEDTNKDNKEEIKNNTSNTNTTTNNNISNSNNKQTQSSSEQAKTIDKNYSKIIIFSMLSIISLVTIIGTKKKKVKKNK